VSGVDTEFELPPELEDDGSLADLEDNVPGSDMRCSDWWDRLRRGQSPVAMEKLPLFGDRGETAVQALKMLKVADLPGTPTMAEAGGDWFFDITRALFGSVNPETGMRSIREIFVLISKKNSKTSYSALLMLVALLLNTRPGAKFFFIAPVQDTADLAFSQASGAIDLDPVLQKKLHVKHHLKEIEHRVTGAVLKIVTFDPKTTTGIKVSGGVMIDEIHVIAKMGQKANSALGQIIGGMLPFPEAFCLYTTTQADEPPQGVFASKLREAREMRDGLRTGRLLPILYEFPEKLQRSEAQLWKDPRFWKFITPNMGRSIRLPDLIEAFKTAQEDGEQEFRRWCSQHLNIQIGIAIHAHAWAGTRYWEQQGTVVELKGLAGLQYLIANSEVITAGVDGGGLDDMLGLALLGRRKDGKWLLWTRAWIQEDVLDLRKSESARFRDFERDGDLVICKLPGEDVVQVADIIEKVEKARLLDKIGVDQAGIAAIVQEIVDRKIAIERIVGVPQGWKLVGAIKTTERKLKSGDLFHGGTRLMAYSAGNAKAVPRGNAMMIDKQTCGTAKIDPLMATFNAVTLMTMDPKPLRKEFQVMVY